LPSNAYSFRKTTIEPTILSPTGHDLSKLDSDAVRAVARLIDRGFESYLVGGCVRDLLLDRTPKDYDIATEARPPQVKRTFPRNCRIIGRRFKLAHLHFHRNTKILECSTFRRTPQENENGGGEDDLLITRDNEFGTAEEDALRRDFTINALFLDPTEDRIVDHVNGLEDIEKRVIRTIGDPEVRFREDPVRILRAAKFAGRLGFTVEKKTLAAMKRTAEDLVRAAPPRVLEEILRLLRSGHAHDSFRLLQDVGALQHLIPVLGTFHSDATDQQSDAFWDLLQALDEHVQSRDEPPQNGLLLGALLYGVVLAERERQPERSTSSIAEELLGPLANDLRLPRRDSGCLKRIIGVQHRFAQDEDKRRFRVESFVRSPYFAEALELFALRTQAEHGDLDAVDGWRELAGARVPSSAHGDEDEHEDGDEPQTRVRKKRRRRRRRRDDDEDDVEARRDRDESEARDGERDDDDDDRDHDGDESHGDESHDHESDEDESRDVEAASEQHDDAPKKKRRRRRRRRSVGEFEADDPAFPASEEPAPHGDAMQKPQTAKASVRDPSRIDPSEVLFPADPGADELAEQAHEGEAKAEKAAEREAPRARRSRRDHSDRDAGFDDYDDRGRERYDDDRHADDRSDDEPRARRARSDDEHFDDDDDDRDEAPRDGDERADRDERESDEDAPRRRRRRRGRRGRGRSRDDDAAEQREEPQARPRRDDGDRDRDRDEPSGGGQRGRQDKKKRAGKKRRSRKGGQQPRDVDVVPRYRDRRGKVEVIEPVSLDLSAFDVELDPKRVPTFGSIVEGKGRPKRRGPRMPDKGRDEYKPPPPPGGGHDAPPPPPSSSDDDSDTFGDW